MSSHYYTTKEIIQHFLSVSLENHHVDCTSSITGQNDAIVRWSAKAIGILPFSHDVLYTIDPAGLSVAYIVIQASDADCVQQALRQLLEGQL